MTLKITPIAVIPTGRFKNPVFKVFGVTLLGTESKSTSYEVDALTNTQQETVMIKHFIFSAFADHALIAHTFCMNFKHGAVKVVSWSKIAKNHFKSPARNERRFVGDCEQTCCLPKSAAAVTLFGSIKPTVFFYSSASQVLHVIKAEKYFFHSEKSQPTGRTKMVFKH